MPLRHLIKPLAFVTAVAGLATAGYFTRAAWLPWFRSTPPGEPVPEAGGTPLTEKVILTDQAQKNLGLTAKLLKPETYWKAVPLPGMVVDRPGRSDRTVVAPATGVVIAVHRLPGEPVKHGEALFTLKLSGESPLVTQTELFKTVQDIKAAQAQRQSLVNSGDAVAGVEVIKADSQIVRLETTARGYRQELLNRGLTP